MIGSILPSRARSVRSRLYFLSASYPSSALAVSAVRPFRISLIAAFKPCAVTLPASSAVFAPDFTIASAISTRSTGTKLSPAFLASVSASASTFAVALSRYTCAASPDTLGSLPKDSVRVSVTRAGSPPAAAIRLLASPWSSSSSAFNKCSGVSRWWLSRVAIVCAA